MPFNIQGSGTVQSTLNITSGPAGFGTIGVETGSVYLLNDALLEFASGQIGTIAGAVGLNGANARIADAGTLASNSALTGLNTIAGQFVLYNGASVSTTGGLSLTGNAVVEIDGPNFGGGGGSRLTIGGTLTNSSTNGNALDIGNTGIVNGDTVTVTDTTLSGGAVTITAGPSGNETISAATDTAASTGKSVTYFAKAGADSFTGGFENDTIYAGTGLGTYTAGSGSDSFVFMTHNLPNQTLANFNPAADNVLLYGIHASNGFDLGSTDNALNPTTATAIDSTIFVSNASGAFTSSSQRFAYDTANGHLLYSATGSNTSESLVATLTGAPAITASNLLFVH
ncbi:MAG: serralysin [Acetobacteraceae bacterium]|nr:serralysin [Acetobacteraceae bacterium]